MGVPSEKIAYRVECLLNDFERVEEYLDDSADFLQVLDEQVRLDLERKLMTLLRRLQGVDGLSK